VASQDGFVVETGVYRDLDPFLTEWRLYPHNSDITWYCDYFKGKGELDPLHIPGKTL